LAELEENGKNISLGDRLIADLKAFHKLFPLLMEFRECWVSSAANAYEFQATKALYDALQDPKPERRKASGRWQLRWSQGDRRSERLGDRRETT
jgi:hypothetical protein